MIKDQDNTTHDTSSQHTGSYNNHRNLMMLFQKVRNILLSNESTEDVDSYVFKVIH